jgi:hypothetical protein
VGALLDDANVSVLAPTTLAVHISLLLPLEMILQFGKKLPEWRADGVYE